MFVYNKIPNVYAIGSLILMTAVSSEGSLVVNPMNTAVVVGSRTTLNCSSNRGNSVFWSWISPNGDTVAYGSSPGSKCVISSTASYASSYDVVTPSTGSSYCNLVILNATSAIAGSYLCSDGALPVGSAVLLVLASSPQCPPYAVNSTVVYPDQVTMNCSAEYNSSSGFKLHWFGWSTTNCSESFHPNNNAPYSTLTCNTSASTPIPSYSCAVVYGSSDQVNTYTSSCSTNPVNVNWYPRAVTISGAPGGYIVPGSNLICSASGNPSPTYQWFNSTNNLLAIGPSLTVWNQDTYTCTASNNANGSRCSTSVSQFVNVTRSTTQKPATTVSSNPDTFSTNDTPSATSNGSTAAAIVLGILFAVSLIFNLICIVYYIVNIKRNHAAEDKPRIYEAPQNTITQQEASSTMYTSLELPTFQEGSESMIRGRGRQSIYEVPLNKNVEPEASSTMYTPLELPGKQGGVSKDGLYENALKIR